MKSNEKNYLKRFKAGKEDALEFIVDKNLGIVKGTLYKIIAPLDKEYLIEECINDVFLAIWNNRNKFTGTEEDLKKWIYKIAKFKAIDYYRRESRNKEDAKDKESIENIGGENISSEDEFIIKEDNKTLINLINNLELMDRNIFTMKYFLGMSSNQIADKLGTTRTAIDNRIYRAKKKMMKSKNTLSLGEV